MTETESGVIVTIWSWPSSIASRVWPMNAATSEPEVVGALAEPDDERAVAPGTDDDAGLVGVDGQQREGPSQPGDRLAHRCGEVAGALVCRRHEVRGDLRVRLGQRRSHPGPTSSVLREWKFSMIPLWMSASRRSVRQGAGGRCRRSGRRGWPTGCARWRSSLRTRVRRSISSRRLASLPERLRTATWSPSMTAIPAES
jgi:hypothetical protein